MLFTMPLRYQEAPWVRIEPEETCAGPIDLSINIALDSWFLPSFPIHFTIASCYYLIHRFPFPDSTSITKPSFLSPSSTMSSFYGSCNDLTDFYCEGRSDPSIDVSFLLH
jgi:hypothetical protein